MLSKPIKEIFKSTIKNRFNYKFSNRVLCSDPIDPICKTTFEQYGWTVTELPKSIPEEELIKIIPDYEALVVRSGTTVTPNVIEAAENLKYIGRAGSGVDNINLPAATNKGILVMNTPGGNTVSTAEHTMSLIMSLSRNVAQGDQSLKRGEWARKKYTGVELQGKTIGIIGLGKIGQYIGKWCQAFEMNVIAFDPVMSEENMTQLGISRATLNDVFEQSDYITVHTPLNDHTRNLINKESLAKCKDGVRLVNCARGGIINEEDLLEALDSGKVAGAALDVFTKEPLGDLQLQIVNHPKVVSTPHLGASTEEAQIKVAKNIARQIAEAQQGKKLFGVVNSPQGYGSISNPAHQPYLALGEKMGQFLEPITPGDVMVNQISIGIYGQKLQQFSNTIKLSILKGYLNHFLDQADLNYLNTQSTADGLGIKVEMTLHENEHEITDNAIEINIKYGNNGSSGEKTITGSLYNKRKDPYMIKYNEQEIFLPLQDHIIFYHDEHLPGTLNSVTNVLSENQVNIKNLYMGNIKTDSSLTCVQTEKSLQDDVVNQIKKLPNVRDVSQISLNKKISFRYSSATQPSQRPNNPNFSSGPCSKHPEFDLVQLSKKDSMKVLGRSHRSKLGKARIQHALEKTKDILNLPSEYLVGLVPASDTGAVEMSMWSMLGQRPVDCAYWESFGKGWFNDIANQLKLEVQQIGTDNYGTLPDLSKVRKEHDLVFAYNGTTSGVRVPNLDFISEDRQGITIADCTSAVFAQNITPYSKLDVITYSWQKVLGGEGAHGILILSPRAVERLESYTPSWPLPKIFRMTKKGKLDKALFTHSPINTPSMLCIEDYIDSLEWVERLGGLEAAHAKADSNLKVVEDFIENEHNNNSKWIQFLAEDKNIRSNTSVCLKLDATAEQIKKINTLLEEEGVAFDINGYKDAPPSLRIWCGATVQSEDISIALQWVKYAYQRVLSE